jgi:hypothetical protein
VALVVGRPRRLWRRAPREPREIRIAQCRPLGGNRRESPSLDAALECKPAVTQFGRHAEPNVDVLPPIGRAAGRAPTILVESTLYNLGVHFPNFPRSSLIVYERAV